MEKTSVGVKYWNAGGCTRGLSLQKRVGEKGQMRKSPAEYGMVGNYDVELLSREFIIDLDTLLCRMEDSNFLMTNIFSSEMQPWTN